MLLDHAGRSTGDMHMHVYYYTVCIQKMLTQASGLQILSNYGHPDYTCMYGVAIHGEIAKLIAGHQS